MDFQRLNNIFGDSGSSSVPSGGTSNGINYSALQNIDFSTPAPSPNQSPSQQASDEEKKKKNGILDNVSGFFSNLFQSVSGGFKQVFNQPAKQPEPTPIRVPDNLQNTKVNLPQLDVKTREAGGSARPTQEVYNSPQFQATSNLIDEVFKNPVQTLIDKPVSYVLNNSGVFGETIKKTANDIYQDPLVVNPLYKAIKEYAPKDSLIGKTINDPNSNPLGKFLDLDRKLAQGTIQGAARVYGNFSPAVEGWLNQELEKPVKQEDIVVNTIGQVVGTIGAFIAGGEIAAAAKFGKAALPVVFATLGQTSLPSSTPLEARGRNAIIDATAGALLDYFKPIGNLSKLESVKSLTKSLGVLSAQIYSDARSVGASHDQALEQVKNNAFLMLALHGVFVAGKAGEALTKSKFREGDIVMSPDQVRSQVNNTDLKGTELGNYLMKQAAEAETKGKDLAITGAAAERSKVAKTLGLKTPQGISVNVELIDSVRPTLISETGKPGAGEVVPTNPKAPTNYDITKPETLIDNNGVIKGGIPIVHGVQSGATAADIAKDPGGFTLKDYSGVPPIGKAAMFTDSPDNINVQGIGTDSQIQLNTNDLQFKAFNSSSEEAAFIKEQGTKTLAEAVNKAGYDGIFRPDFGEGGNNYLITNKEKLDQLIKGETPTANQPVASIQTPTVEPISKIDVPAKEQELRTAYQAVDKNKIEEELFNIWQELDAAEAGSRTVVRDQEGYATGQVIGSPSTFPKWIPEDLRSKDLFQKMLEVIKDGVDGFKYPEGKASRQRALLDAILSELDSRLNIDTSTVRADIIKGYEETVSPKVTKPSGGSVKRNQGSEGQTNQAYAEKVRTPSGHASDGTYADLENRTKAAEDRIKNQNIIEMPELVKLARELSGKIPEIKKLRTARGHFDPNNIIIRLHPDIFKNPEEAAKTLAHEIGHLTDFLPDNTMAHGNLVGRLANLQKNLKNLYGDLDNKVIRKELIDLTQLWKPFDEASVPDSYKKYRYSSSELYADAISVLFNDPVLLREQAPEFYKGFFDYLDRKPEVKENFFALQDLLYKGEDAVLSEREQSIRDMFTKGEDLFRVKVEEQKQKEKDYAFRLKYELIDQNQKVIDFVNKAKKEGKIVTDDDNPIYWLEGHNYVGGVIKNWVETSIQPVYKRLTDAGITWEDFGEVLFLERVANDRSELANPLGFTKDTAGTQLEYLKKNLGEEKSNIIAEELPKYRDAIKKIMDSQGAKEFYNPELLESIKKNPAYATYQVLDYFDVNLPASIKHQVGTLKEISNPATSTIVKTMSIIRAIERNQTKGKIVKFLKNNFTEEIQDAKTIWNGKSHIPVDPKERGLALFTVMEQGKFKGYYVDPYIASTMEHMTTGHSNAVLETFKFFNSKGFRPLFITFNLGFQSFNFMRDFLRTYKNLPTYNVFKVLNQYRKAIPAARARAFELPNKTIQEMENSKILNVTFNDLILGASDEDKQIDSILNRYGLSPLTQKKTNFFIRPFEKVLDTIKRTGDFIETLPKVAGYNELNGKLPNQELASFIRTSIGSPDFMRKGAGYRWYNEVFLFSNAIKEGVRADYNIAFKNPKTRGGYWWKTAIINFLPKLLMFAAGIGLFGAQLKKMFDNISEYDKTNYTTVPLTLDNGKTVYLRIPQDETGRLMSGILWKGLNFTNNDQPFIQNVTDVASLFGGQVPSATPALTSLMALTQFMGGQNPYDFFRGRNVIPDTEFKAGGMYALKPFVTWELNNLGLGVFMNMSVTEKAPETKTWYQKVIEAPVASNIIGRWIKVSDYGQKEDNQKIIQEAQQKAAVKTIEQKQLVNDYLKEWKASDKTTAIKNQLTDRFVKQVVDAADPEDKAQQAGVARRKITLALAKGEYDANTDSLISATSNDAKLKILQKVQQEMSFDEFNNYKKTIVKEGIVSATVLGQLERKK